MKKWDFFIFVFGGVNVQSMSIDWQMWRQVVILPLGLVVRYGEYSFYDTSVVVQTAHKHVILIRNYV